MRGPGAGRRRVRCRRTRQLQHCGRLVEQPGLDEPADLLETRLDLPLLEGETVEQTETVAPQPWQDLMLGKAEAVRQGGPEGRPVAASNPSCAGARVAPPNAILPPPASG